MATTPRRNPKRGNPATPTSTKKPLLYDGEVWCNCEPRKRAALHQVGNTKPTKGEWYYRCRSCDFYMWKEHSLLLQETTPSELGDEVLDYEDPGSSKTPGLTQKPLSAYGIQVTPRPRRRTVIESSSDDDVAEEARPQDRNGSPRPTSPKRKRDAVDQVDSPDDPFISDLDSDMEMEMAALADMAEPRSKKTAAPQTPTANTRTIHGLPTPSTTRTLFPDAANRRTKTVSFEEDISEAQTPSKTAAPTPSQSPGGAGHDSTDTIMDILSPHGLPADVLGSVREELTKSAQRTRGIVMSRDGLRHQIREKDSRIAKLQDRIAALENKERGLNRQLTNIKADLMRAYTNN